MRYSAVSANHILVNSRVLFGIAMLCVVALVSANVGRPTSTLVPLRGLGCGSKGNMIANPDVKRILADRFSIGSIDCPGEGSITICTDEKQLKQQDFVWPASLYAIDLCQKTLGHNLLYDVSFHSPIVFYSWDCVARELMRRGEVEQVDGVYYIVDMQGFARVVLSRRDWQGACGLAGKLAVIPTDPTKSNSGSEFVALLATMLLNGDTPDETTIEPILPDLKKYVRGLGALESTSGKLFPNCIHVGMGGCPIFAVYESQGIDFIKQYQGDPKDITDKFRTLYPRPTVWAAHELIAVSDNGKKMIDAMKDKQIQEIAWKNHGFRTGYLGNPNDPDDLGIPGVPDSIVSVVSLPSPAVMNRITEYLKVP